MLYKTNPTVINEFIKNKMALKLFHKEKPFT